MLIREIEINQDTSEGIEEGPIWDKVKKTAAAGAVAGGLGYAALSGSPAQAATVPSASTQTAVTQQMAKAPDSQQAAKIERIRKAVDSLPIAQVDADTIQHKLPTTVDDQYFRSLTPQQLDAEVKRWEDLAKRNKSLPPAKMDGKLTPQQQTAAAKQAAQFEADGDSKTKTKTAIDIDDIIKDTPGNVPAKKDDGAKSLPDMPRATIAKTAQSTAGMTPTDAMRDMMSRMQVPDDLDLDDEDVLPEPVEPNNVPAVIRREIANTDPNAINPDWHIVSNLPGNIQQPIRQLGRALFGSFTRTPTQDITMIGNIAGQGPNSRRDVAGVMDWIRNNARRVDTAGIDFDQTIPGYRANISQHTSGGVRFMIVRDQFGEYVYAWPEQDSLDAQAQIPGAATERLN